jgi:hypothetical protein
MATLERVFGGMSGYLRYLRYHAPVPRLTTAHRRALTEVDVVGRSRANQPGPGRGGAGRSVHHICDAPAPAAGWPVRPRCRDADSRGDQRV